MFQVVGPATEKERLCIVAERTNGTLPNHHVQRTAERVDQDNSCENSGTVKALNGLADREAFDLLRMRECRLGRGRGIYGFQE